MNIRRIDDGDVGYCMSSWCASHKDAMRIKPWGVYKAAFGPVFKSILDDPSTRLLGAYVDDTLVGWIAATPGKRVHTLHWVYVKHDVDGRRPRRHGVMTALLEAADLGSMFVYTLRARRKLDDALVAALRARGVTATHVPLREWMK